MGMKLLRLNLPYHLYLLLVVILQITDHVALSVPLSLEDSEACYGVASCLVCCADAALDVHVGLTGSRHINLNVVVDFVLLIFRADHPLHPVNLLFLHRVFLLKIALVPVDPVELLQDQVEAPLQRSVICVQLIEVLVGGTTHRILRNDRALTDCQASLVSGFRLCASGSWAPA